MPVDRTNSDRNYGLDWLRIGAFGLLILYHIGMFFVPWPFHLKTANPIAWLEWPMLAVNPWRLLLLFMISGMVSRSLIGKVVTPRAFAMSRTWRLLVPLIAGIVVIVAPQPWVQLKDQGVYQDSLIHFWFYDYAEFGASRGTPLPTWNHLWFIAYLWVYSMALATLSCLPQRHRAGLQHVFNNLFSGWALFVFPVAWLFLTRVSLHPISGETHAFVNDPYAHSIYMFAFLFGVGFAQSDGAWKKTVSHWKLFMTAAFSSLVTNFWIKSSGGDGFLWDIAEAATRSLFTWSIILGLFGLSQIYLNQDGPTRRYLAEAVFPYYIVHQTILLVAGYQLKRMSVGPLLEFAGMLIATVIGCALTFEITKRVGLLRPLFGLKAKSRAHAYRGNSVI